MTQCKQCGTDIIIRPGKSYDKKKKFCGYSCATKFNNSHRVITDETKTKIRQTLQRKAILAGHKLREPKQTPQKITKLCVECNTEYIATKRNSVRCTKCIPLTYSYKNTLPKTSNCLVCNAPCRNIVCSIKCNGKYKRILSEEKIRNGTYSAQASKTIKTYIISVRGHQCELCKLSLWMNKPIPLVMDHINGRAADNSLSNLRLICPNCDHQQPTFGSKNKNSDRKKRATYIVKD